VVGTPLFMAPEQFSSSSVDHRADLFSLGSLLYTLCTGRTPFHGDSILVLMRQVCTFTPLALKSLRPEVPVWLATIINKLLAKLPAARFQSATEVVEAFAREGK
jgi:serine/threonine protein kinase